MYLVDDGNGNPCIGLLITFIPLEYPYMMVVFYRRIKNICIFLHFVISLVTCMLSIKVSAVDTSIREVKQSSISFVCLLAKYKCNIV